jgi:hypothetical protein
MKRSKTLSTVFNAAAVDKYLELRLTALHRVRDYGTRIEEAYHALFDKGLIPLEEFMQAEAKAPLTDALERAFAKAAGVHSHITLNSMLGLAARRFDYRPARMTDSDDFLLTKLEMGGATVNLMLGSLVLPEPGEGLQERTTGAHPYTVEFAPKTRELVKALESLHIFSDDLVLTSGALRPGTMRQKPYTLLEIPKLGRQVAVCDQIGEITFVSTTLQPLATWAGSTKDQLRALPGMSEVRYDEEGKWLNDVLTCLSDGMTDINKRAKVKLPRRSESPLLTEDTLIRWIQATHDYWVQQDPVKAGKWPNEHYTEVWDKDPETGEFKQVVGENWRAIDSCCSCNLRGLKDLGSLAQLKDKHSLNNHLTEDTIVRWIKTTKEKTGAWPLQIHKEVWDKDPKTGEFKQVVGETWKAIDICCNRNLRGLKDLGSLAQLKKKHGCYDTATPKAIPAP